MPSFKRSLFAKDLIFHVIVIAMILTSFLFASIGISAMNALHTKKQILTIIDAPKGLFTPNFNPLISDQSSRYGTRGLLYETLLFYNRVDSSVKPWLAESYTFSKDHQTITFKLRPHILWQDNKPMTSMDVKYTLELLKQHPLIDQGRIWKLMVKSVEAPDKRTVVVHMQHPDMTVLWYVGSQVFIVPQHIWSEATTDPVTFRNQDPIGTGPYLLKSFTNTFFKYKKNPQYWQKGKPVIDEIHLPAVSSGTTGQELLGRNDLDWTGIFYDPKFDDTYRQKDPDHNKVFFPPSNIVTLYPNLDLPLFQDITVRRAISLAINRQELINESNPWATIAHPTGLLPTEQRYMATQYKDASFTQNKQKAQELLQASGYTKGDNGIYQRGTERLSFQLLYPQGWSDWEKMVHVLQQQLSEVGIDVTLVPQDFSNYFANVNAGNFELALSWTNPGPTPYYLVNNLLNSVYTEVDGRNAITNLERWQDEKTDELLNAYRSTSDPTQQTQALHQLQGILVDKMPVIFLINNPYWAEYSTKRFVGWPSKDNFYAIPSPYTFPDSAYVILNLSPVP